MTLPAGEQTLSVEAKTGKLLAYRYTYDYYVDYPLEIKFNKLPEVLIPSLLI